MSKLISKKLEDYLQRKDELHSIEERLQELRGLHRELTIIDFGVADGETVTIESMIQLIQIVTESK